MYYNEHTILWNNGEFQKASEAKTDLYSQSLHYGYAVFEGIRAYTATSGETTIFKARQHYDRLRNSAKALNIPYDFSTKELIRITYELLEKNNLTDAYIRPVVYAPANMSFSENTESYLVIQVWEMKPFLGSKLLRVMLSSFCRPNPGAFKIEAKASGHYVNSILASQEAKAKGFDEALLCDINGFVAEGPGANMFYEKDGKLFTPPAGNILPGITRATVLEICSDLQIQVVEKLFKPSELKHADAAFFCGTAAEIIGWESFDGNPFGKSWENSLGQIISIEYQQKVRVADRNNSVRIIDYMEFVPAY